MGWRVEIKPSALKSLQRAPASDREQIRTALERLPAGWLADARKLKGIENEYRLRVGRWRVRFAADKATKTLTVLAVVQRKEAYRK